MRCRCLGHTTSGDPREHRVSAARRSLAQRQVENKDVINYRGVHIRIVDNPSGWTYVYGRQLFDTLDDTMAAVDADLDDIR